MTKPTCATCPFWDPDNFDEGDCRKNPPVVVMADIGLESGSMVAATRWPQVDRDDWCGEHPDFAAYTQAVSEDRVRCGSLVQDNWNRRMLRCNLDAGHTGDHDFTVDKQPPSK